MTFSLRYPIIESMPEATEVPLHTTYPSLPAEMGELHKKILARIQDEKTGTVDIGENHFEFSSLHPDTSASDSGFVIR